jgi:hypothetical protein
MASVTWRAIHFGRRMGGNCQPEQLPRGVLQDQQSMQQPKRHCRHYEQVDRGNAVGTIVKEGLPALRGWPPLGHVFCHRGLADLDAELEQFAVDARRAPVRIGDAHFADQLANFGWGTRSPPLDRDLQRQ